MALFDKNIHANNTPKKHQNTYADVYYNYMTYIKGRIKAKN